MSRYLSSSKKSSTPRRESTYSSRRKRMKEEQKTHKIKFEKKPKAEYRRFEETVCGLYGVPGIGKSRFAYDLGVALQNKHNLDFPGIYVLQCEPINHPWEIRKTHIPTWPTFREFIDKSEQDPEFVSSVKMWVIDTLDALIPKGISTICCDLGVVDMKDATVKIGNEGWSAVAWQELRHELIYQILRLQQLGPGVLILSHERNRSTTDGRLTFERPSMDLSGSIYNSVGDLCSMIFRMRGSGKKRGRCLSFIGSEKEDAKDNLNKVLENYPDGIIEFKTEKQVVRKILDCFDSKSKSETETETKRPGKKFKKSSKKRRA